MRDDLIADRLRAWERFCVAALRGGHGKDSGKIATTCVEQRVEFLENAFRAVDQDEPPAGS